MPKTYARLTEEERYQMREAVTEKWSHRDIATLINKHHSTVSREVKCNTSCAVDACIMLSEECLVKNA